MYKGGWGLEKKISMYTERLMLYIIIGLVKTWIQNKGKYGVIKNIPTLVYKLVKRQIRQTDNYVFNIKK